MDIFRPMCILAWLRSGSYTDDRINIWCVCVNEIIDKSIINTNVLTSEAEKVSYLNI